MTRKEAKIGTAVMYETGNNGPIHHGIIGLINTTTEAVLVHWDGMNKSWVSITDSCLQLND